MLATATGPSAKHLLGTDDFGKDQLSQILYAGQVSLTIGLTVAALSTLIGVIIGSLAGFYGRFVDQGQPVSPTCSSSCPISRRSRAAEILRRHARGHDLRPGRARLDGRAVLRGDVLALKEKEFVEGARARQEPPTVASSPDICYRTASVRLS